MSHSNGDVITINKSMVRFNDGGMVIKSPKTLSSNRSVEYPHFVIEKLKEMEDKLRYYATGKEKSAVNTALFLWTWRELNPRPKAYPLRHLPSQSLF